MTVQHAGTAERDGQVVTSGGRVLSVTAVAPTLELARAKAYEGIEQVRIRGSFSRSDIAAKAARGEISVPATDVRRQP